jgi:hypothetical protein
MAVSNAGADGLGVVPVLETPGDIISPIDNHAALPEILEDDFERQAVRGRELSDTFYDGLVVGGRARTVH